YLQSLSSSTRRSACLAAPRVLSPPKTSGAGARFRIERLGAEIFPPRVSRMAILSVRATRSAAASSDFDRLSAGERWLRTSGSWSQSRDRQTVMGDGTAVSEKGSGFGAEPKVRIHLPPAGSRVRTGLSSTMVARTLARLYVKPRHS